VGVGRNNFEIDVQSDDTTTQLVDDTQQSVLGNHPASDSASIHVVTVQNINSTRVLASAGQRAAKASREPVNGRLSE
jgi:hypothetical protein